MSGGRGRIVCKGIYYIMYPHNWTKSVFRPQNLCVLTKKGLVLRPEIIEKGVFPLLEIRPTTCTHITVGVPGVNIYVGCQEGEEG